MHYHCYSAAVAHNARVAVLTDFLKKKNSSTQADTTIRPGVSLNLCANEWCRRQGERQMLQEASLFLSFPPQGMQASMISMDFIYCQ